MEGIQEFKALFERKTPDSNEQIWVTSVPGVSPTLLMRSSYEQLTGWLQYVGMDDENGVKVYEYDVFKFQYRTHEGKWINLLGSFVFGEDLSFEIDVYNDSEYIVLNFKNDGHFKNFEVVGNIKETPDLIETIVGR